MIEGQNSNSEASEMEATRARLQAMAEAADRGEIESPLETSSSAEQDEVAQEANQDVDRADESDQADKNKAPDSPKSSAEQGKDKSKSKPEQKESENRNQDGTFKKTEKTEPPKPESNYSKAKKDEARLNRNRQEFEQEKSEFRRKAAEFETRMSNLERQTSQPQQGQSGPRLNAEQFELAAQEFERQAAKLYRDGDPDGAEEKLGLSKKARINAAEEQRAEQGRQHQQFLDKWNQHGADAIKENPELEDANSEAGQAMHALLQELPILYRIEDGFKQGVALLKLRRDSAEAFGLREENETLKARVAELEKLTTPEDGKPSRHSAPKTFEHMTLDQQREHLRRQAELADEQAA